MGFDHSKPGAYIVNIVTQMCLLCRRGRQQRGALDPGVAGWRAMLIGRPESFPAYGLGYLHDHTQPRARDHHSPRVTLIRRLLCSGRRRYNLWEGRGE